MRLLLSIRNGLSHFYGEHDTVIRILFKFLLACAAFGSINAALGQMSVLNHPLPVMALAAICAFLPSNSMILLGAALILIHFYAISPEAALAGGGLLVVGLLLYFSIAPHSAIPLVLTGITMGLGIPGMTAVIFGLIGGPLSAIGVVFGVLTCYLVGITNRMGGSLESTATDAAEAMVQKMTVLMDAFISNREMLVTAAALAVMLWVILLIRRLAIKYAWLVASVTGLAVYILVRCLGNAMVGGSWPLMTLLADAAVSILTALLAQGFLFSLDYRRTENVRFEDDDYFYYVKAVPKKKVHRKKRTRRSGRR